MEKKLKIDSMYSSGDKQNVFFDSETGEAVKVEGGKVVDVYRESGSTGCQKCICQYVDGKCAICGEPKPADLNPKRTTESNIRESYSPEEYFEHLRKSVEHLGTLGPPP